MKGSLKKNVENVKTLIYIVFLYARDYIGIIGELRICLQIGATNSPGKK
jgi:hypothetical protein